METRANKRKRALMANPYQRTFLPRARTLNPVNKKRSSSVNNLRSRRVFSPSSISDVNVSSSQESDEKEIDFGGKSELGFKGGEIEIGGSVEEKGLDQSNQKSDVYHEDTAIDGNVQQQEGDEQAKLKINRLGAPLVSCSRKKVFQNPSSFSYRRMLPYLLDLAKDDTNSLEIHLCQKVQKSSGERPAPSLSVPQDIPTDEINKEVFAEGHPFGGLNTDPIPSNAECSNMISLENQISEPMIVETPKTPILLTANPLNKELPHLLGEIASQGLEDMPDRSIKFPDVSCAVHETNLPVKLSLSLATPQSIFVKVGTENAKQGEKDGGTTEVENCENEQIQSTPPDNDIFCKPGQHKGKNDSLECQRSNVTDCDKKRRVGDIEKDTHSNSRAKLGTLTPSSRMKIYRTPGSFSYRRLLPYLMDLKKNDTSTLGTQPCKIIDKTVYEEPSSLSVPKATLEDVCGPDTLPILKSTETNPPAGSDCINLGSDDDHLVPELSAHTDVESPSQVKEQPMDEFIDTEPTRNETNLLIKSPPSLAIPEPDMNSPEVLSLNQEPSSIAPFSSPRELISTPSPSLQKSTPSPGILKRYPRGCRGLCTCLKCTSFRLHAERAFEFSRNQMEDSQDVAMALVKELSSIRALLENSANGAECDVLPVAKVKEACMKALRTEEAAKSHLKEMNQELHFHCKIPGVPRPRVRFAEKSQMLLAMEENSQPNGSINEMKQT
ncbi:hypothetical protein ACHQM5_027923 [Ranunculus cassubicifolius]